MVNVLPVLPATGKPANEAGTGSLVYAASCETETVLVTPPIGTEMVASWAEAFVFADTSNVTVNR